MESMKNKIILWIIGGISAFVIFVLFIFAAFALLFNSALKRNTELDKKRTAETVGTITYVDENYKGVSDTRQLEYSYEHVVNGTTYSGTFTNGESLENGKKNVGLKGKVCYDPSVPAASNFHFPKEKATCGQ
jgi:hypothetical protein